MIIAAVWILLFVLWFVLGDAARARVPGPALTASDAPRTAMSDIAITFAILVAVVVAFVSDRVPVGLVAIGAALALCSPAS